MLCGFFKLFPDFIISENTCSLEINGSIKSEIKPFIEKLFDELNTISKRDSFEFFLDISGSVASVSNADIASLLVINNHIDYYYENNDDCDIQLKVKKNTVEDTISVYFPDLFSSYLNAESVINVLSTFSTIIKNGIYFEVFSVIDCFYTKNIVFYQHGFFPEGFIKNTNSSRDKQLEMFSDSCTFKSYDLKILPCDFHIVKKSNHLINIQNFFNAVSGLLSLIFIVNYSEIKNIRDVSYKISGYKMVSCEGVAIDIVSREFSLLYKIYSWAYDEGNKADKLGLVRNVLSIHLDEKGLVRFDNEAWNAIQSNYQVYLKENLATYLEVKNKIGEFVIDATTKTSNIIDQLLDSLKNSIFVLLTFLLTVVLVNGVKDIGYKIVFSKDYLAIVFILTLISVAWMFMSISETRNRFENLSSAIKGILILNYSKLIMQSEIENIVDPTIEANRVYLNSQLSRYRSWWLVILLVFFSSFAIGTWYFHSDGIKADSSQNELKADKDLKGTNDDKKKNQTKDGSEPVKPNIKEEV